MPRKEKGQAFVWDVVLATSVFLIILGILVFQWTSLISSMLSTNAEYEVSWLSTAASEQLVRTSGSPFDWNNGTAAQRNIIFGLADYERAGNNTRALDRILDPDKVFMYLNASQNYTWMRYRMLGSGIYDYYIQLSCLNNEGIDCFNGLILDSKNNALVNCSNNASFSSREGYLYAVYNNRNLSGVWRFSEGAGAVAYDSSGNMKDGQIIGPEWVPGRTKSALSFDGWDDYVNISADQLNDVTQATFTAWVKFQSLNTDDDIFVKGKHDVSSPSVLIFRDDEVTGGNQNGNRNALSALVYDGTHMLWISSGNDTLNDLNWHHIAVTFNASSTTGLQIYIDGKFNQSGNPVAATVEFIDSNTQPLRIGRDNGSALTNQTFNGSIEDVRVYTRALTAEEIYGIYNASTQYCLLGNMNTTLNDTSYIAADTKTFTFSEKLNNTRNTLSANLSRNPLTEDIPNLEETGRMLLAVYKQKSKSN
jgi:hypothetical protein